MTKPPPDRVVQLAEMRRLAAEGVRVRSARQARSGMFRSLPTLDENLEVRPPDPEQLDLFGGEVKP